MQIRKTIQFLTIIIITSLMSACGSLLGSSAVPIGELPVYPDAVELEAGNSLLADTLARNEATDAAVRQAAGVGGSTEQRGFQLPAGATWDEVNSYYAKELEANGWSSGLGGIAGGLIDVNEVMKAANQGNDAFNTAIWSKDKQNLTVMMIIDPTNPQEKALLLSLATQ